MRGIRFEDKNGGVHPVELTEEDLEILRQLIEEKKQANAGKRTGVET